MAYQVIARKYRPQRFEDVVGQEHVTQTLANAIEQKRLAHAYIFSGPRGTGKTTIARIFAKCLNATGGPTVKFSDDDSKAQEITEGRSIDVLEIDGASNNGVEQVRELRETVKYMPASSKFKIFIIDEVHMLSTAAFNALLKTLEEPPEHVKFMFATTEPEKVLPTILSRCQRFDLRRIPAALIVKHLGEISAKEKVKVDDLALYAIARGAEGCMRDAESTLDQLISFCGEKIEEADVLSMFGLTAHGQILELSRAVLDGEIETALRQLNELVKHGKDLGRLLSDLLNHFRNLLIYQVSKGDLKLLEVSEPEAASLKEQSAKVGAEPLTRIMEVLADYESRLRDAASKKILVEVALLNAIQAKQAVSIDSVLKQLNELRSSQSSAGFQPAPPATRTQHTAPPTHAASIHYPQAKAENPAPALAENASDLEQLWARLLEAIGRVSPFTRTYLLEAHPVSLDKNIFTIGFDPEFQDHIGLVDNSRNHTLIQTKLHELGHSNVQIKFVKADAPVGRVKPTLQSIQPASQPAAQATAKATTGSASSPKEQPSPTTFNKEDFKNDPLIQKALEIFKGQIVDVRS